MADLTTHYMGLTLRNPLIAGSSGLTGNLDSLAALEKAGAGAVVLKSVFEEQIRYQAGKKPQTGSGDPAIDAVDAYYRDLVKHPDTAQHLELTRQAKAMLSIPVIASIHCVSAFEWVAFARAFQEAGADGIELNIFISPSDPQKTSEHNENTYLEIINTVRKHISIPVSVKISPYFANLTKAAMKFSWTGIAGLVLFNRFYSPDFDIDTFEMKPANIFSSPSEICNTLRWVGLLSTRVSCDLAASTGIHDGAGLIKVLLAGAKAGQVASVLYTKGLEALPEILGTLEAWMDRHRFACIEDFCGRMSLKKVDNPAVYERIQFMKLISGID